MESKLVPQVLFSQSQIEAAVTRLATQITRDYHDKHPVLVGILKGSFVFMADLVRQLDFPLQVEFVRISSYGQCAQTSGKIKVIGNLHHSVKDRHVLIVEDIIDTGLTTSFFLGYVGKKKPATVKLCALTDKPSRRRVAVNIDYLGFTVPNKFIVGYGIDYAESFRNLPSICFVEVEC